MRPWNPIQRYPTYLFVPASQGTQWVKLRFRTQFVNAKAEPISYGAGFGIHRGRDRCVGPGDSVPPMFGGHHSREFSMENRSGSTRQAPVLGWGRGSAILSFIWVLFQSSFFGPHVIGLRFDGAISFPMWDPHVLLGIRLSYWLVLILILLLWFCFNLKKTNIIWFVCLILYECVRISMCNAIHKRQ